MTKCKWCGEITTELHEYHDAIGDKHNICSSCKQGVDDCICRKCGNPVDPSLMINGLCTNCVQVEFKNKSKRREEAIMGVDREFAESMAAELTFTEEEYEKWLFLGNAFSPDNMNSKELRRLWIMVKLNAAGIYDSEVISNNFIHVEKLLDRNLSKLINNKCRIVIGNSPETRKIIKESDVIDYEDAVYILKA